MENLFIQNLVLEIVTAVVDIGPTAFTTNTFKICAGDFLECHYEGRKCCTDFQFHSGPVTNIGVNPH